MKVKKLSEKAHLPERAKPGDLGYDLFADKGEIIPKGEMRPISSGIALEFPAGWGGIIKDRSSMAAKRITVSAGVIDGGYRGEIIVLMSNHSDKDFIIEPGDKIAQLVPTPETAWDIIVVDELNETHRGEGGFGSTGKKKTRRR